MKGVTYAVAFRDRAGTYTLQRKCRTAHEAEGRLRTKTFGVVAAVKGEYVKRGRCMLLHVETVSHPQDGHPIKVHVLQSDRYSLPVLCEACLQLPGFSSPPSLQECTLCHEGQWKDRRGPEGGTP